MSAYGSASAQIVQNERLRSDCRVVQESADSLLRAVWEESTAELSRLVRAMGVTACRADDVLQDVYLTAWRKRPPGIGRDDLRRWLVRVATNRCNLEHRRRSRWRAVVRALEQLCNRAGHDGDALGAASRAEERELVRRALDEMEPPLRSILVLRYFAQFDSKEIGKILEMPDSTVRSRLRKARGELAVQLKRLGYSHD